MRFNIPEPGHLLRTAACFILAASACPPLAGQQKPSAPPADFGPLPELPKLDLPALPSWDRVFSLHTAFGFKDNVLLGNFNTQASPFVNNGVEIILLKLPVNGWQWQLYLAGEDTRYFSSPSVDKEQIALAISQLKKEFTGGWSGTWTAQYLYQNLVLDLSASETQFATLLAQSHGYTTRFALRKDFASKSWFEIEPSLGRQDFDSPVDDYWEIGPKTTIGLTYGHRSELALSHELLHRAYDTREQSDAAGFTDPGAALEYQVHRLDLVNRHHFDEKRRWRLTSRLGYELNSDNGSGYFDYRRWIFSEQLRFRDDPWEMRGQIRASLYAYPVQPASATTTDKRSRSDVSLLVRAERKLGKQFKLYSEYEYERSLSNQPGTQYAVNIFSFGLNWEY